MKKIKVEPGVSTLINESGELHQHEFVGSSTVHISVDDDYEIVDRELVEVANDIVAGNGEEVMKSVRAKRFKDNVIFDVVSAKLNHLSRGEGVERDEKGQVLRPHHKPHYKLGKGGSLVRDTDREKVLEEERRVRHTKGKGQVEKKEQGQGEAVQSSERQETEAKTSTRSTNRGSQVKKIG